MTEIKVEKPEKLYQLGRSCFAEKENEINTLLHF